MSPTACHNRNRPAASPSHLPSPPRVSPGAAPRRQLVLGMGLARAPTYLSAHVTVRPRTRPRGSRCMGLYTRFHSEHARRKGVRHPARAVQSAAAPPWTCDGDPRWTIARCVCFVSARGVDLDACAGLMEFGLGRHSARGAVAAVWMCVYVHPAAARAPPRLGLARAPGRRGCGARCARVRNYALRAALHGAVAGGTRAGAGVWRVRAGRRTELTARVRPWRKETRRSRSGAQT